MASLAGLDVSGAEVNALSAATEAQPMRPRLFIARSSDEADTEKSTNAAMFSENMHSHRALWRKQELPDPAVGRHEDVVSAELEAIVLRAKQLLKKMPKSPMANARLARALLNEGNVSEAAEAAAIVSNLPLTDGPAAFTATLVLLQTGQWETADKLVRRMSEVKASENGSGVAVAFRCLAAALAAERGDLDLALLRVEGVPGAHAHALRGYLLLELAQTQRALHELRMARNSSPVQTPALLLNIAYSYAVLGSPDKAIRTARQALVVSPRNSLALRHLAGYLLAAGRPDEAVSSLRQVAGPHDDLPPDLATALANAFFQAGDPRKALQVLRETAQRSRFRRSDAVKRAEIRASIAFLEFRLGKLSRRQRLEIIRKQQDQASGQSVMIACMLADVLASRTGRSEVLRAYEGLRAVYPEKQLLPLRARLASMAGDLAEQLRLVREWANAMPLDADALTAEVYLLCEFQEYRAAASAGLTALQRFPHAVMLRNNTAYALALTGEIHRASRVLKPISDANAYAIATAGLIELRRGRISEGFDLYRKAAEVVHNEAVDAEYASQHVAQLAFHLLLILKELHLEHSPLAQDGIIASPRIDPSWLDDPTFMAMAFRARRLSVPWPPTERK